MKAASLAELKKNLLSKEKKELVEICLRLAKFKADNKSMLSYLLLEAEDEAAYIRNTCDEIKELFNTINTSNLYYYKKGLRKVLRKIKLYAGYSESPQTEIELLIYFLTLVSNMKIDISRNEVIKNLIVAQFKRIDKLMEGLHEDLKFDYEKSIRPLLRIV